MPWRWERWACPVRTGTRMCSWPSRRAQHPISRMGCGKSRACGTFIGRFGGQDLEWKPWSKEALMLSGRLKEWPRATAADGD